MTFAAARKQDDFAAARKNMVDCQIHTASVVSEAILDAFETVPKELFVPAQLQKAAYLDDCIAVGGGRFIMAPVIHARMLQAMTVFPGARVLDVGCASGYSSLILARLGASVTAVEQDQNLLNQAQPLWKQLGAADAIKGVCAPLPQGSAANGPYDFVIVNGSVSSLPHTLIAQLKTGGTLICILTPEGGKIGQAVIAENLEGGQHSSHRLFDAAAPYLPGFEPVPGFKF